MKTPAWIAPLFWSAALYDGVLGAAFLFAHADLYSRIGIPPPNHPGYIQFPASLLLVFAVGFAMVAVNPRARRDLIVLGIGLKVAYSGVVLGNWFTGSIPIIWTIFAWTDLVFLLLFIVAWNALRPGARR